MLELTKKNTVLKNRFQGKRCFVIGTGPSLEKQDIQLLKDEHVFVVNQFYKHESFSDLKKVYYCFADPAFFSEHYEFEVRKKLFEELIQQNPRPLFFVPVRAMEFFKCCEFLNENIVFYFSAKGALADKKQFTFDLEHEIPGVQNVLQLCLIIAMYMGFSEIYILGAEHDWLSHRKSAGKHFYKKSSLTGKGIYPFAKISYRYMLECVLRLWKGYEHLLWYANQKNIRIMNATPESFLDVFEYTDYCEIFNSNEIPKLEISDENEKFYILKSLNEDIEYRKKSSDDAGIKISILQTINRYHDIHELRFMEVECYIKSGEYDIADVCMVYIAEKWPSLQQNLVFYVDLYEKMRIYGSAIKIVKHLYEKNPGDVCLLRKYVEILTAAGEKKKSIALISSYIKKYKFNPDVKLMLESIID